MAQNPICLIRTLMNGCETVIPTKAASKLALDCACAKPCVIPAKAGIHLQVANSVIIFLNPCASAIIIQ